MTCGENATEPNPGYEEYGSVTGPADPPAASGEPFFAVRDQITGEPVRCFFGEELRAEVAVLADGERTVCAEGILQRAADGRLLSVRPVCSVRAIGGDPPGDLDALFGAFVGIDDTQEHLRRIRGG